MNERIDRDSYKPVKINNVHDNAYVKKLIGRQDYNVIDQYEDFLLELFLLRNPKYKFIKEYAEDFAKFKTRYLGKKTSDDKGSWYYFPWLNSLIHFLPENEHQEMRTGRNRNLITLKEQDKFYNSTIAILGMSVGSHAALTIALTGGAKRIKLADFDIIGGSNLNRIRTGYQNIGLKKVISVAREIYLLNPYSEIEIFPEGVTESNIENILGGKNKVNLIVEEMDSPYFKIRVRELAKQKKIPVIMAADHNDSAVVDVERFDLKSTLPIMNGLFGKLTSKDFKNIAPTDIVKIVSKMAGAKYSGIRMLESVFEVGKSLYTWPQLGTAATLCGSVLAQLARRILVGEKIVSGRYDVNLEKYFTSSSKSEEKRKQKILKQLGVE